MHKILIMDTTLRDGEQTSGVNFTDSEKLNIAKLLLEDLKVDKIEIASARVSKGEFSAVEKIVKWSVNHKYIDKIEVLGFVDGTISVDWVNNAGCKTINLLCKGSLNHVTNQLRKTPEQHIADIKNVIEYAKSLKINVNVYLEDWSNGMKVSRDYVYNMIDQLKDQPIERYMLPDTLGILNPDNTYEFCKLIVDKYPTLNFDFHAHNDYDLAAANVFSAVKAGIQGIHTTVNGLGERAGNPAISSVIPILKDHLNCKLSVDEEKINKVSVFVENFSSIRIPPNKPIIGENVFTQVSGVHADGDNKANLYFNDLMPERFGRIRKYALGKTAGKANIKKNLEALGIELDAESMKRVTERVIELGDKKENVTAEDLPYIIADVIKTEKIIERVKLINYSVTHAKGLLPVASISLSIDGKIFMASETGDGQYDAFMKAVRKVYKQLKKQLPILVDYAVTIPPGGKTNALVQTVITWSDGKEFKTRGLDSDQTSAAIKATVKMLNIIDTAE